MVFGTNNINYNKWGLNIKLLIINRAVILCN